MTEGNAPRANTATFSMCTGTLGVCSVGLTGTSLPPHPAANDHPALGMTGAKGVGPDIGREAQGLIVHGKGHLLLVDKDTNLIGRDLQVGPKNASTGQKPGGHIAQGINHRPLTEGKIALVDHDLVVGPESVNMTEGKGEERDAHAVQEDVAGRRALERELTAAGRGGGGVSTRRTGQTNAMSVNATQPREILMEGTLAHLVLTPKALV